MTRMVRLVGRLVLLVLLAGAFTPAVRAQAPTTAAPPPATTAAQEEYLPISELPDSEKLPAAPFLVTAYIIVWGALLVYVWTLWTRLGRVEAELREARRSAGSR